MIIAVCTDDKMIVDVAKTASERYPTIFGKWFKVFHKPLPMLGVKENLFIVAHGAAKGEEKQPVIGSKKDAFYLTARDLNANLHIFPSGYSGGVYVSACESIDPGVGGESFVEAYMKYLDGSYPNATAWGQTGEVDGPLPLPTSKAWILC